MKFRALALICSVAASVAAFSAPAMAGSLSISYFDIANPGANLNVAPGSTDFGICCSSPNATSPDIVLGSGLGANGLPVAGPGSDVQDLAAGNQIVWWGPLAAAFGIHATGSGSVTLPFSGNMFAPNSMGTSDDGLYETAELNGQLIGNGSDAKITVTSDDDALVYVDGKYVGGNPGVHSDETTVLDLGDLTGVHSLDVFYADRARVGADLSLDVTGATITDVPEPVTLSLFGTGLAAAAAMRRRRKRA